MSNTRIPSPARSLGASVTPRPRKSRATRSVGSSAKSTTSGRLSDVIQFKDQNKGSFFLSPMSSRRSVLNDGTEIEEPRRRSWWKKLGENSRDVMDFLKDDKILETNAAVEEYIDIEVLSQEKKNYTLDIPDSSDSASISSIVIPQRKLFTLKDNQIQQKFSQIVGKRDTLAKLHKTAAEDKTLHVAPKNLFSKETRQKSKPVFPEALLNLSQNKTVNKTKEMVAAEVKGQVRTLFGNRQGTKRKNMFADFIVSDSEDEISEIQPKVFGLQKSNKKSQSPSSDKRDPSPTSSITIDIEMDDWKLLPSSTMVEHQLENMMGVARTPVKRARLSKMPEIKELTVNKSNKKNKTVSDVDTSMQHHKLQAENNKSQNKAIENVKEKKNEELDDDEMNMSLQYEEHDENDEQMAEEINENIDHQLSQDVLRTASKTPEGNNSTKVVAYTNTNIASEENATYGGKHMESKNDINHERVQDEEREKTELAEEHEENEEGVINEDQEEVVNQEAVLESHEVDEQDTSQGNQEENDQDVSKEKVIQQNEEDENQENETENEEVLEENQSEDEAQEVQNESEIQEENGIENEEQNANEDVEQEVNEEKNEVDKSQNKVIDESEDEEQNSSEEVEQEGDTEDDQVDASQNKVIDESEDEEQNASKEEEEEENEEDDRVHESEDESQNVSEIEEMVVQEESQEVEEEEQSQEMDKDDSEEDIEDTNEDDQGENNDQDEDDTQDNEQLEEYEQNASDNTVETPNATHDTTGRNRNKRKIDSPEAILHDKTNVMESFMVKGRNTSLRRTSMMRNMNIRPSMAPARESTGLSDGTTNSSAEGSGWDSHRTTRKTMRQTFGKDFSPRKSLRALVMEKSAKRQTAVNDLTSVTSKFPLANSTELSRDFNVQEDDDVPTEANHDVSKRTRQTTLEMYLQKIKKQNIERKLKVEEEVKNSLKAPTRDVLNPFKVPSKPMFPARKTKTEKVQSKPKTKQTKALIALEDLPPELIEDMKYKPPKRFRPSNAAWITKRLYKHLETKLEPKYDYKARVRAEKLVQTIYNFTREVRRAEAAPRDLVEPLKLEMARLDVVRTHFDFYQFFHDYMPREVRVKVVPDIVNKIPLPRHGISSDILRGNNVQG